MSYCIFLFFSKKSAETSSQEPNEEAGHKQQLTGGRAARGPQEPELRGGGEQPSRSDGPWRWRWVSGKSAR